MTAEIAIMNKYGVALAADSAVSIGTRKVYNSANKLFALSCKHPVGIMIYGGAQFMGVPWETIIKWYRTHSLCDTNFASIEDFAVHFQKFLTETDLLNGEHETLYVCSQAQHILNEVRKGIIKRVENEIETNKAIDVAGTQKCVEDEILHSLHILDNLNKNALFTANVKSHIHNTYEDTIKHIIASMFEKIPLLPDQIERLVDGVIQTFGTEADWGNSTGIVIAGFGEKEIYPCVKQFEIEGRVGSYLKVNLENTSQVTLSNRAIIKPFAQREMVDTFMRGMDPSFFNNVESALRLILHKIPENLMRDHGIQIDADKQNDIQQDLDRLLKVFIDELAQVQQRAFISPVTDSVAALPLDELASMAEALVNLTSFKRRVTMVQESVGGPIDVAVISKGDGFIWIKRKHYFSAELNHHFFTR